MGSTSWSDDHYAARMSYRAATATPTFAHDADVRAGRTADKIHPTLNVFGKTRESCDSDAHPDSLAIAVFCDVTGSMQKVPELIQKDLVNLMGLLLRKNYVNHPHILVGAIGDAISDHHPFQAGQFEAGIEIEDNLTNLLLEGGGGGSMQESYELALYFMARHTKIDCFTKRGKKGYLFLIGDEQPYNKVETKYAKSLFDDAIQGSIPVETILAEAQERYHVYYIMPKMTNHWDNPQVLGRWRELLGQNVLKLEDPEAISQLIATTIGINEGVIEHDDISSDLKDLGESERITNAVTKAVAQVKSNKTIAKKAKGADLAVTESGAASGITAL